MSFSTPIGLSQRQVDTMLVNMFNNMKNDLVMEYTNTLYRQGRARDTSSFSRDEEDMSAMCDAYSIILFKLFSKVMEANNKKIQDDIQNYLANK